MRSAGALGSAERIKSLVGILLRHEFSCWLEVDLNAIGLGLLDPSVGTETASRS